MRTILVSLFSAAAGYWVAAEVVADQVLPQLQGVADLLQRAAG